MQKGIFSNIPINIKHFFRHQGVFLFITLIISLFTTFAYYNSTKEFPRGSILRILLGTAHYPFQTRILVYKLSYFLANLFNANLYYVFFAVRWITIILILIVLKSILKELKIKYSFLPFLLPFATLFSFFDDYWYPTDFMEILFFCVMFLLILKSKPLLFTAVFGFSFLNRESTIFILPFFIYFYLSRKKTKELLFFCVLLIIIILTFQFLLLIPATQPISKEIHPWKFSKNISLLQKFPELWRNPLNERVRHYFYKLMTFSGLLYLLVLFYWKNIPTVLKYFLAIIGPINFISGLTVGNLDETRILYPIIPGLIISSTVILRKKSKFIKSLNILIIMIVIIFLAKHGILLKKESEFLIKSRAFNLEEFKQWKKDSYVFQKSLFRVKFQKSLFRIKEDRIAINLRRIKKNLLFLDSTIFIKCPGKRPLSCTFWLNKNLKITKEFKEYRNYYYVTTKNLQFEMKNPSVQSIDIKRIVIKFEGEINEKTRFKIKWKGFSIENKT